MAERISLTAQAEAVGKRLDVWLASEQNRISRSAIQKLIPEGLVLVNGKSVKSGYKIRSNDNVILEMPDVRLDGSIEAENIDLDILYEDNHIAVINKKAGMVVHPGAGIRNGTLANALLYRYGSKLPTAEGEDGAERPGIVHRLDKETSGLMVVALNDKAHRALSAAFSERKVKKEYRAIVWGAIEDDFTVDQRIKRDPSNPLRMAVNSAGRDSLTEFKVVRYSSFATLLNAHPQTGRTHQIRVHTSYRSHPIVGDDLYGGARELWMKRVDPLHRHKAARMADAAQRVMLHAGYLSFTHPSTKRKREFSVDIPDDFKEAEKWII
ncbi:MAG: RluA family pseudouridine synthase [Fibrobacteres bacterium]|nr:RluA family pseudouridine synthase [Fibrobacterota bacterium]